MYDAAGLRRAYAAPPARGRQCSVLTQRHMGREGDLLTAASMNVHERRLCAVTYSSFHRWYQLSCCVCGGSRASHKAEHQRGATCKDHEEGKGSGRVELCVIPGAADAVRAAVLVCKAACITELNEDEQ